MGPLEDTVRKVIGEDLSARDKCQNDRRLYIDEL